MKHYTAKPEEIKTKHRALQQKAKDLDISFDELVQVETLIYLDVIDSRICFIDDYLTENENEDEERMDRIDSGVLTLLETLKR